MVKAFINGIGWVTSAGLGQGRANPAFTALPGPLPRITRNMLFAEPETRFGRLDDYSKMGLAAITMALRDAGMPEDGRRRPISVIAGSALGCMATDLAYLDTMLLQGGALASPNLFAYTLPNCFLAEAAIRFGFTGASFIVQDQSAAGGSVLRLALETLADGDAALVFAGVCNLTCALPGAPAPDMPSAAFFLALGAAPAPGGPPYGELCLDDEGIVRFGTLVTTDLFAVVQACLAGKPVTCA